MLVQVEKIHVCSGHRAAVYALAPGQTERHFLTAGGDGWVVEWDLGEPETGRLLASVETQVFSLAALPDRQRMVAGNMNGGVHWINRGKPEATRNIQHHKKGTFDLQILGDWLFSIGGDGMLSRWDLAEGRALESLRLSAQSFRALAVSPDQSEIAVGASDRSIYFLDAKTLEVKHIRQAAHDNSVFTLTYSPDGKYLLSGGRDAMLRVWDLKNEMQLLSEQPAHWYTINHICFSPDGRFFATASRDKTLKIWDASSFGLLKVVDVLRFGGHTRSVNRLLWLEDCLVSCGDDGLAMLWKITAQ